MRAIVYECNDGTLVVAPRPIDVGALNLCDGIHVVGLAEFDLVSLQPDAMTRLVSQGYAVLTGAPADAFASKVAAWRTPQQAPDLMTVEWSSRDGTDPSKP